MQSSAEISQACPSENAFARLIEGLASDQERAELEQHVDVCPTCSELVVALGRAYAPSATASSWETDSPGSGDRQAIQRAQRGLARIELFAASIHVLIGAKLVWMWLAEGANTLPDSVRPALLALGLVWGPCSAILALAAARGLSGGRSWGRAIARSHAVLVLPSIVLTPLSWCILLELGRLAKSNPR